MTSITPKRKNPDRLKTNIALFLLLLLISAAVYKTLMQIHAPHFTALQHAAYGIIEGKPHWIAYQNRLLGPTLVYIISKTGISYPVALKIFTLLTIVAQNFLLFFLLRKTGLLIKEALTHTLMYALAFLLVQHRWFYTWDSIDAIIFTLFAYGVVQNQRLGYFLIIFFIELLNRESALFISLFIIINAFTFSIKDRKIQITSKAKLLTGILLTVAGAVYTKFIRDYLFISRSDNLPDNEHQLIGNHINLITNLKNLFFYNLSSIEIINTAFILGSLAYLIHQAKAYTEAQIKAVVIYSAIVANILIFGTINETRMYIILLPFIIFIKSKTITHASHKTLC